MTGFGDAEILRLTLAAGDEKRDEFERLFGKAEADPGPKPVGAFTRAFFGPEAVQPPQASEGDSGHADAQPPPIVSYTPAATPPKPSSGEFTRIFGAVNTDGLQGENKIAEARVAPEVQSGPPAANAGTLTGLFAEQNRAFGHAPKPEADTFNRFFNPEAGGTERAQPPSTPGFTERFQSPGFVVPASADPLARSLNLPAHDSQNAEKSRDDLGAGAAVFPDLSSRNDAKATRLFSLEQAAVVPAAPVGGPSAFTRITSSSAQRSATERADSTAPPLNSAPPQPPPAPVASVPAPVLAPQWPGGGLPSPQAYAPPLAPQPPQMSMPAAPVVAPMAWQPPAPPQAAPPPIQSPQFQAGEQPPQPGWIAYLPLIIGLNVLLFLASIIILIVASMR